MGAQKGTKTKGPAHHAGVVRILKLQSTSDPVISCLFSPEDPWPPPTTVPMWPKSISWSSFLKHSLVLSRAWGLVVLSQGEEGLPSRGRGPCAVFPSEMFLSNAMFLVWQVLSIALKSNEKEPFCVGTIALVLCGSGLCQSSGGSDWH